MAIGAGATARSTASSARGAAATGRENLRRAGQRVASKGRSVAIGAGAQARAAREKITNSKAGKAGRQVAYKGRSAATEAGANVRRTGAKVRRAFDNSSAVAKLRGAKAVKKKAGNTDFNTRNADAVRNLDRARAAYKRSRK